MWNDVEWCQKQTFKANPWGKSAWRERTRKEKYISLLKNLRIWFSERTRELISFGVSSRGYIMIIIIKVEYHTRLSITKKKKKKKKWLTQNIYFGILCHHLELDHQEEKPWVPLNFWWWHSMPKYILWYLT
jgi:hypothetical protein